jgi:acetylornithine deacetylase/succinyl-diaminopimelate desuccinylase-like protein
VSVPGANPVVFGEIRTPGATRTIVFYAHYDGQPLDPKEWASPPFEPVLRDKPVQDGGKVIPLPAAGQPFDPEWRLYARGSGDDKAPIIAMLTALDAIRAAGIKMRSNIKFAFEGEEEAGSPNLEKILDGQQGAVRGRPVADVRRAGLPDAAAADCLRGARRYRPGCDALRSAV